MNKNRVLTMKYLLLCAFFIYVSGSNIEVSLMTEQIRNIRENSNNGFPDLKKETYFWSNWLAESSVDFLKNIKKSLSDPEWWNFWVRLPEGTREEAVSRFLRLFSDNKRWNLHCSYAFHLCLADRSCRWRFWNYLSSCSTHKISLKDWAASSDKANIFQSLKIRRSASFLRATRPKSKNFRNRKARKRRQKHKNKSHLPAYLKRVFRSKTAKTTWLKTTEKLHYWMGRYWSNIFVNSYIKRECSSKCLNALLMLNQTIYSTLLATCDCSRQPPQINYTTNTKDLAWNEAECKKLKAKALVCRPRLYKPRKAVIGCTESRLRCQNNPKCNSAQTNFLLKCSRLISGVACSKGCREAIKKLSLSSQHFNTCVCDGAEKRVCSEIRQNIKNFCPKKNCSINRRPTQSGHLVTRHDVLCAINKTVRRTKKSISYRQHVFNSAQTTVSFSLLIISLTNIFALTIIGF